MQRIEKPCNLRDLSPELRDCNAYFHSLLTPKWENTGRMKGRYVTLIRDGWQNGGYSAQPILPDSVSLSTHRESFYKEWHIVHGKACLADNGRSLIKRVNAVHGHEQDNPQGVAVASRNRVAVLGKGTPIPDALRLDAKHRGGNAEIDNFSWTEY